MPQNRQNLKFGKNEPHNKGLHLTAFSRQKRRRFSYFRTGFEARGVCCGWKVSSGVIGNAGQGYRITRVKEF